MRKLDKLPKRRSVWSGVVDALLTGEPHEITIGEDTPVVTVDGLVSHIGRKAKSLGFKSRSRITGDKTVAFQWHREEGGPAASGS